MTRLLIVLRWWLRSPLCLLVSRGSAPKIPSQGLYFCRNIQQDKGENGEKGSCQLLRNKSREVQGTKEYLIANKNTKKGTRADDRKYIDGLAEAAEQVARARNMKGLNDTTKRLVGKFRTPEGEEQQRKRSRSTDKLHKTHLTLCQQPKTWMQRVAN